MKLLLDCPEDLTVNADSSLLEQAVVNLVDNAVKYSPSGETVRITGAETAARILIAVEDHGCGIPEKEHKRIFERFYRVHQEVNPNSVGIGLSLTKSIVEGMGGSIRVKSEVGNYTWFILTFLK